MKYKLTYTDFSIGEVPIKQYFITKKFLWWYFPLNRKIQQEDELGRKWYVDVVYNTENIKAVLKFVEVGYISFTTAKPAWMFYEQDFNSENLKVFKFNTIYELKQEFAEEFL